MVNYNNKDWIKLLFTFKGSIVREISPKVIFFAIIAAIITALYGEFYHVKISTAPFTIIGGALGFLLVFRTNTSYDRYWGGRKLWGELTNHTRNLGIKLKTYCKNEKEITEEILKLHFAFLNLLKLTIRDEKDYSEVKKYMSNHVYNKIDGMVRPHIALSALISDKITELKNKKAIDEIQYMLLMQNIDAIVNAAEHIVTGKQIGRAHV